LEHLHLRLHLKHLRLHLKHLHLQNSKQLTEVKECKSKEDPLQSVGKSRSQTWW
jgi:hypothetical protein